MTFCLRAVRYGEGGGDSEGAASYRTRPGGNPYNKWPWSDKEGESDPRFFSLSVRLQWGLSPCSHSGGQEALFILTLSAFLSIRQKNGRALLTPRRDTRWDPLWLWTVRALTVPFNPTVSIQGLNVPFINEFTATLQYFEIARPQQYIHTIAYFHRDVLILKFMNTVTAVVHLKH